MNKFLKFFLLISFLAFNLDCRFGGGGGRGMRGGGGGMRRGSFSRGRSSSRPKRSSMSRPSRKSSRSRSSSRSIGSHSGGHSGLGNHNRGGNHYTYNNFSGGWGGGYWGGGAWFGLGLGLFAGSAFRQSQSYVDNSVTNIYNEDNTEGTENEEVKKIKPIKGEERIPNNVRVFRGTIAVDADNGKILAVKADNPEDTESFNSDDSNNEENND